MKELIKELRMALQLNQEQFSKLLGTTSITISRWENGKSVPNLIAQKQLYEIYKNNHINLTDFIIKRDYIEGENTILYHASRNGINGKIAPISRSKCDFGKGFYMGTDPLQPLALVCNEDKPIFYTLELDTTNLKILNIEVSFDWAMLIAYYRGYMVGFENTHIYKKYSHMADNCDVITGYIADDRMYQVLTDFFDGRITDSALVASLSVLKLGKQYVAVSQKACDKINILKSRTLDKLTLMILMDKSTLRRKEGKILTNQALINHRRDGRFFDEIMNEDKI